MCFLYDSQAKVGIKKIADERGLGHSELHIKSFDAFIPFCP